jgi:hypothetical protein
MSEGRPRSRLLSRLAQPLAAMTRRVVGGRNAKAAAPGEAVAPQSAPLVGDSFALALEGVLQEDEGRFQTRLQIVSLIEFREAVGDKWHRVAEKVMLIAEGVINLHLGQGNVCGHRGPDFFVLVFRTCSAAEARRRAVLIAQELGTRLVGDQFSGFQRPLALAAEVSLAEGINPEGGLNLASVRRAVGDMRAIIAEELGEKAGGLVLRTAGATDDDRPLRRSLLPGRPPEQATGLRRHLLPSVPAVAKAPQPPRVPSDDPGWQAQQPRRLAAECQPPQDTDVAPVPPGAALQLLWRPTWVAAGEAIGASKAHVQRIDRPGETAKEGCLAYPDNDEASAQTLDRFVIASVVRGMLAAEAADNRTVAIVPMHWASLVSAERVSLTAPFADLSEAARTTRLVIDLFGVPAGVDARDLADTVRVLRPLCREVFLRVKLSSPLTALAADCGAAMVGLDLSELRHEERADDAPLLAALGRFRDTVLPTGLGCYIWGVRRRTVVVGTVLGGFAMVNGPGLMKDLGRPAQVLPAPKARFNGATAAG